MAENRLIDEKSPYLLQHAHNPVDWHPWGDAAFEKARKEDKPVFLSVGYATCHWCHVMEKESFEDAEAAKVLNDTFVSIKVDREERPDIDAVYMAACQMLTGSGGWPLTVFMTPDKRPFFAGTYIPKRNRFNRPGLIELCEQVKRLWKDERAKLLASSESISGHLGKAFAYKDGGRPDVALLDAAYRQIEGSFDAQKGGFGPPPKFPTPHKMLFLLRHYHRTGEEKALKMVRDTLTAMRMGGVWDHVGFGFHRYSTDRDWLVPHFEKMLYDQALMAMAGLETFQITRDPFFSGIAEDIFTYVLRDMTDADGPFYAAEDADSEGEEGKFYVWTPDAFRQALGEAESRLWERVFNLTPEGNFAEEAAGRKTGANIPHLTRPLSEWAAELGTDEGSLTERWEAARQKLFEAREQRVHPLKDDKVLADWNGMMISAMALGGRVLNRPDLTAAARKSAQFVLRKMQDGDCRLLHRYRDGKAGIAAHADDYAFLIDGLLTLYRTTFLAPYIQQADALQNVMMADFRDEAGGGFFLTAEKSHELPVRPKALYDGATPSANSVALLNLLRLGRLTGDPRWEETAQALTTAFSGTVASHPSTYTYFLMGLDFILGKSQEVVIVGEPDADAARAMIDALNSVFAPHQTALLKTAGNSDKLAGIAPFTADLPAQEEAAAYVCTDFACGRPVHSAGELAERIASSDPASIR